jgi:hypothetical protein
MDLCEVSSRDSSKDLLDIPVSSDETDKYRQLFSSGLEDYKNGLLTPNSLGTNYKEGINAHSSELLEEMIASSSTLPLTVDDVLKQLHVYSKIRTAHEKGETSSEGTSSYGESNAAGSEFHVTVRAYSMIRSFANRFSCFIENDKMPTIGGLFDDSWVCDASSAIVDAAVTATASSAAVTATASSAAVTATASSAAVTATASSAAAASVVEEPFPLDLFEVSTTLLDSLLDGVLIVIRENRAYKENLLYVLEAMIVIHGFWTLPHESNINLKTNSILQNILKTCRIFESFEEFRHISLLPKLFQAECIVYEDYCQAMACAVQRSKPVPTLFAILLLLAIKLNSGKQFDDLKSTWKFLAFDSFVEAVKQNDFIFKEGADAETIVVIGEYIHPRHTGNIKHNISISKIITRIIETSINEAIKEVIKQKISTNTFSFFYSLTGFNNLGISMESLWLVTDPNLLPLIKSKVDDALASTLMDSMSLHADKGFETFWSYAVIKSEDMALDCLRMILIKISRSFFNFLIFISNIL